MGVLYYNHNEEMDEDEMGYTRDSIAVIEIIKLAKADFPQSIADYLNRISKHWKN